MKVMQISKIKKVKLIYIVIGILIV